MKVIDKIIKSPAEPSNTSVLWIDTSITPNELKYFESEWKSVGAIPSSITVDALQVEEIKSSDKKLTIESVKGIDLEAKNDIAISTPDDLSFEGDDCGFGLDGSFSIYSGNNIKMQSEHNIILTSTNDDGEIELNGYIISINTDIPQKKNSDDKVIIDTGSIIVNSRDDINIKGKNGTVGTVLHLTGTIPTGEAITAATLEGIGLNLDALFSGNVVRVIDKDGIGYTVTQSSLQSVGFAGFAIQSTSEGSIIAGFTQYLIITTSTEGVYQVILDSQG